MRHTEVAQRLGAGAFGEAKIGRVVDDAAGICVLLIDAQDMVMGTFPQRSGGMKTHSSSASRSSCGCTPEGAARPRCFQPRSPSMRPRLVRSTRPSWIR